MVLIGAIYYSGLLLLALFAFHRAWLLHLYRRAQIVRSQTVKEPKEWPFVTVQLPIFNEPSVVSRLLRAVAALDYPLDRIEVQVLDDSTDETSQIVADEIDQLGERGEFVRHLRRTERRAYKAGALAEGMLEAKGEFLAIFDADFVPEPDFLRRLIPFFSDREVGVVQARWSFLNRDESRLTRAQALMLDSHFEIEQNARAGSGLLLNFNGTAGIWRRRAIDEAGGWSGSTLTEDLELSLRAQLRGWKIAYVGEVAVPCELPPTGAAYRSQQYRWAKGSAQVLRMHAARIIEADLPFRVKAEVLAHLTSHTAYAAMLAVLLTVPWIQAGRSIGSVWNAFDAVLLLLSTASVVTFFAAGRPQRKRMPFGSDVLFALGLGLANTFHKSLATADGLIHSAGEFVRTPKRGDSPLQRASERATVSPIEVAWLAYLLFLPLWFIHLRLWFAAVSYVVLLAALVGQSTRRRVEGT